MKNYELPCFRPSDSIYLVLLNERNWKPSSLCARMCVSMAGKRERRYPITYIVRCYPTLPSGVWEQTLQRPIGKAVSRQKQSAVWGQTSTGEDPPYQPEVAGRASPVLCTFLVSQNSFEAKANQEGRFQSVVSFRVSANI